LRDFSGDSSLKDQAIQLLRSRVASCIDSSSNNSTASDISLSSTVDISKTPAKTNIILICFDRPRAAKRAPD